MLLFLYSWLVHYPNWTATIKLQTTTITRLTKLTILSKITIKQLKQRQAVWLIPAPKCAVIWHLLAPHFLQSQLTVHCVFSSTRYLTVWSAGPVVLGPSKIISGLFGTVTDRSSRTSFSYLREEGGVLVGLVTAQIFLHFRFCPLMAFCPT